ncbi:YoaK family protein [Streptomyces lienomycini]|uniref:YoaK family protein n=1 Tax=Streptomyces lienomycini TaxID=284035 RepID=UPI002301FD66|nr:YoaK family protein [Streptomyces lienomycini]
MRAARLLTFSAGAVNAWGFLSLGGVFTSVVTANSAMFGIGLGSVDPVLGGLAGLAVLCYVLGAAGGGWSAVRAERGARALTTDFLFLELVLLWVVAAWWLGTGGHPSGWARTVMLGTVAAAMGCQNAGVRVAMGGRVTTAYLTGLLTRAVVEAVTERRPQRQVLVTMGLLVLGAVAFTLVERWLHAVAAVFPALAVTAAWLGSRYERSRRPGRPTAPARRP